MVSIHLLEITISEFSICTEMILMVREKMSTKSQSERLLSNYLLIPSR